MNIVIYDTILETSNSEIISFDAKEIIFEEGVVPQYFYHIIEGETKLCNYTEDGKEIIQALLEAGQSIGEFMLFMDKTYPVSAVAITPCKILKLSKGSFLKLVEQNPEIYAKMTSSLCSSMYFKFVMGQVISSQSPTSKLIVLMDYLKSCHAELHPFSFQIPLTRQQMASLTGLCVETTIRTIKMMEKNKVIKILNGKVFY